jgi:hypothetical protein
MMRGGLSGGDALLRLGAACAGAEVGHTGVLVVLTRLYDSISVREARGVSEEARRRGARRRGGKGL